jgi:hypothetical protein
VVEMAAVGEEVVVVGMVELEAVYPITAEAIVTLVEVLMAVLVEQVLGILFLLQPIRYRETVPTPTSALPALLEVLLQA